MSTALTKQIALCSFYGIGKHLSVRLLARLQIHHEALVSDLTEPQITALSAYLSSPSTTTPPGPTPLAVPPPPPKSLLYNPPAIQKVQRVDPLNDLKIETDLKKSMLADIAHQREIGTYKGRRYVLADECAKQMLMSVWPRVSPSTANEQRQTPTLPSVSTVSKEGHREFVPDIYRTGPHLPPFTFTQTILLLDRHTSLHSHECILYSPGVSHSRPDRLRPDSPSRINICIIW